MKEQLMLAWKIHQHKNILLVNGIHDEGMLATLSAKGGRKIYQQFIHMHNVRMQWLEIVAREDYQKEMLIPASTPFERERLISALNNSSDLIARVISDSWDKGGKVKGFTNGLIPLVAYFISHESHHRGNILSTLKQSGINVEDKVKWGLWEWNKKV